LAALQLFTGALGTANRTKKRAISAVTLYTGQLGLLVLMVRNEKYEVEIRQGNE
jgi:hypothetical protein